MIKKISLLWTIISIFCLHSVTSYAATTNLAYTCAELGYTQTVTECEGQKKLYCPFDKSAVFCGKIEACTPKDCSEYTLTSCPSGAICERCTVGCGDDAVRYKEEKAIVLSIDTFANKKLVFNASGGALEVDWGDGVIDGNKTHTYAKAGTYTVKIKGTITSLVFNTSTINSMKILSLKLPSITSIDFSDLCSNINGYILTGTIPELPTNLSDGDYMFSGCVNLTGSIPPLPTGLTTATHMFADCSGLTGSIPELPKGLTSGSQMFYKCKGLTGTIPSLPTGLKSGKSMFLYCSGLTGKIPNLPEALTDGTYMFRGCSGLTGTIPSLPSGLTDSAYMFSGCSGLTGTTPIKPSGVTFYTDTFAGTQVTNDGSWPSSAW